MKRILLVGSALALTASAILVWRLDSDRITGSIDNGALTPNAADAERRASTPETASSALLGSAHAAPISNNPSPFSHLPQARDGLPLETDPFVAESVAEQKWLDRNGYPNAEQWRVYSAATDAMLQLASERGDRMAGIFLDGRALSHRDKDAPDRLFRSGEQGSMFALALLQAYMASSPNGDPELAYAITRVMEMKGDTRIALGRDLAFPKPLVGMEKIRAEALALQLRKQFESNTQSRPFVDPRPFP